MCCSFLHLKFETEIALFSISKKLSVSFEIERFTICWSPIISNVICQKIPLQFWNLLIKFAICRVFPKFSRNSYPFGFLNHLTIMWLFNKFCSKLFFFFFVIFITTNYFLIIAKWFTQTHKIDHDELWTAIDFVNIIVS